jgi:hypothetical protein
VPFGKAMVRVAANPISVSRQGVWSTEEEDTLRQAQERAKVIV